MHEESLESPGQERPRDELAAANATLRDEIARRTAAEAELRRTNQALEALIGASPLPIIALDDRGRVTRWNPAAEQTFGWDEREVLGRPLPTIPEDLPQELAEGPSASPRGEVHQGRETRRRTKEGATIAVRLWTAPLHDVQGQPCGRMGIVEELTESKRTEAEQRALL